MKHETAAGQFIELVNARCAQGHDYTASWQFVRANNPSLYEKMKTEGAPKVNLANSANASEIERLRAVIARESKTAVSLANSLMERCAYTFERAWAETKIMNKDVHQRIADAHKRVLELTNAQPNPAAAASAPATETAPSVPPANAKSLHEDFLMLPGTVWDAPDIKKLVGEPEGAAGAMVRQAWDRERHNLKAAAFAKLLDAAAKVAASLFDDDVERARATLAARLPAIARAAVAGVEPAKDEDMAKLLNVPG